jgi:hypothetical protein
MRLLNGNMVTSARSSAALVSHLGNGGCRQRFFAQTYAKNPLMNNAVRSISSDTVDRGLQHYCERGWLAKSKPNLLRSGRLFEALPAMSQITFPRKFVSSAAPYQLQ